MMRHLITQSLIPKYLTYQQYLADSMTQHGDFHSPQQCFPFLRPAAVLLPIVERPEGMSIILTQRTAHLHNHGGQICFPGGMSDAQDNNAIATALRETEEEIGLKRDYVEIAGYLDAYETITGFLITTVVGFVKPGFTLTLDTFEVAEAFEVPLDFVLNPVNHQRQSAIYKNEERFYYVLDYEGHRIWGATAGILMNFYRRIQLIINS